MGLAWEEAGDLSAYASKEEIRLALVDSSNGTTNPRNDAYALWQFANTLKPGDVVFVKGGRGKILGRGLVTGDYEYDEAPPLQQHGDNRENARRSTNRFQCDPRQVR